MDLQQSRVHLVIGSQVENVELVQLVLEEALQRLAVDRDTAQSIGIAVREAVANAVSHGNQENPDKRVVVDFGLDGEDVVIQVADEGPGFDPGGVRDPLAPDNLLRPDGRGLLFMNSFMDDIDYTFGTDGGTVVTLKKNLSGLAGACRDGQTSQYDQDKEER